jgi:hypothetical protein
MNPIAALLAAGAVGLFVLSRQVGSRTSARPGKVEPLRPGVRYLFILRLDAGVTDERAREVLEAKAVENLVLSPALTPPFWAAAGQPFSSRVASFKFTARGSATVTLGEPFYGIGRLETLVRLDGLPFDAEGPSV